MEEQLHPLALAALVVLICLILSLPRRHAIWPMMLIIGLMPMGQALVIFGLNFHLFRLLCLIGVLRVFIRGEAMQLKLTRLDKMFLCWVIVSITVGSLSKPSMELFVSRLGDGYNALVFYFFARCVIVNFEDAVYNVRIWIFLTFIIAGLMMVEKTTATNLLSVFGGVPEHTQIRNGHLRCQGAFRHPILAGTFGAIQFPLFVGLWFQGVYRRLATLGIVSSIVIVIAASSGGAILAVIAGITGLVLWKIRTRMVLVLWGVFAGTIGLAIVMKAPVWYIFDRISDITGGTGWYRSYLIDQAIAHFDEWWLYGTTYTAHWALAGEVYASDPNMMDITNHYIMEGVKGGILKLGLFLAIIIYSFRGIGRVIRAEKLHSTNGFFVWAVGVSLFANCVSFISVNYFDQTILVWYWLLAVICCIINGSSSFCNEPDNTVQPLAAVKYRRYSIYRKNPVVSSSGK